MAKEKQVVRLRFIFANHDGVSVELETDTTTTVGEVKRQLMAAWPKALDRVENGASIRLICMGQGVLAEHRTLADCRVPIFATHPTPVNVSVRALPPGALPSSISSPVKPKALQADAAAPPSALDSGCFCCVQ